MPKSEGRKKPEIRNPKTSQPSNLSAFGGRPSDFGFPGSSIFHGIRGRSRICFKERKPIYERRAR
jgi:hypothetical protein